MSDIERYEDDDESHVEGEEPLTDEELTRLPELIAKQSQVNAIQDPADRLEAARWYQAALAGYPESEGLF